MALLPSHGFQVCRVGAGEERGRGARPGTHCEFPLSVCNLEGCVRSNYVVSEAALKGTELPVSTCYPGCSACLACMKEIRVGSALKGYWWMYFASEIPIGSNRLDNACRKSKRFSFTGSRLMVGFKIKEFRNRRMWNDINGYVAHTARRFCIEFVVSLGESSIRFRQELSATRLLRSSPWRNVSAAGLNEFDRSG